MQNCGKNWNQLKKNWGGELLTITAEKKIRQPPKPDLEECINRLTRNKSKLYPLSIKPVEKTCWKAVLREEDALLWFTDSQYAKV